MSTCWYFHRLPLDRFKRVFGSATQEEQAKLLEFIEDPDEGFDDDELEQAVALAREILKSGISYANKSSDEKALLDEVVTKALHQMGLASELEMKPVSPEPVTLGLAEELLRNASQTGATLISLFNRGRRFGVNEAPRAAYFILMPEEVTRLKAEVDALLADSSVRWRFPDAPDVARRNITSVLDNVVGHNGNALYAVLT